MPTSTNSAMRAKTQSSDAAMAARVAARMVGFAFEEAARVHLFVLPDTPDELLPVEVQWRRKNKAGVTFKRAQRTEAEAWTRAVLMAGWVIFRSSRRNAWATGRGLKHGDYLEDAPSARFRS